MMSTRWPAHVKRTAVTAAQVSLAPCWSEPSTPCSAAWTSAGRAGCAAILPVRSTGEAVAEFPGRLPAPARPARVAPARLPLRPLRPPRARPRAPAPRATATSSTSARTSGLYTVAAGAPWAGRRARVRAEPARARPARREHRAERAPERARDPEGGRRRAGTGAAARRRRRLIRRSRASRAGASPRASRSTSR